MIKLLNLKTYQIYILKLFTVIFLKITGIFLCLVFIMNIFEEINYLQDSDVGIGYPILLTLLNTPSVLYDIFPFIFLITTQFFFINIIEKNELSSFKYSGIKNINLIKFISIITLIFGILIILIFYNTSSKFKHLYLEIKNNFSNDNKYLAVVTENGLWIKDEINNHINIINAEKINNKYLINVSITQFDKDFQLIKNIESEKANIENFNWQITNAVITKNNSFSTKQESVNFETNFNLEKINSLFSNLSSLTIWELNKLKNEYEALGYSVVEINSQKLKIYSYPIYLVVMTILSSILMLNIKYNKSIVYNLILSILMSSIIYYINYFINLIGINGKIPVVLSIWLPILILIIFSSIGLIKINEK